MKKIALSFVLLSGLIFTLTQCESAKKGTVVADKFFSSLIDQDFQMAASMMEVPMGSAMTAMDQVQRLENDPSNGKLQDFKKSIGVSTKINNGITTVELTYKLKYERGVLTYKVVIVNRGGGFKIVSVQ